MAPSIDEKLAQLKEKKKRLQHEERILLERAQRRDARKLTEIGKLAQKAQIESLDSEILLGAFLEIAELMDQQEKRSEWAAKANTAQNKRRLENHSRIVIRFANRPTGDQKSLMRRHGLRWNTFREEFYGHADLDAIRSDLDQVDCIIETIA